MRWNQPDGFAGPDPQSVPQDNVFSRRCIIFIAVRCDAAGVGRPGPESAPDGNLLFASRALNSSNL